MRIVALVASLTLSPLALAGPPMLILRDALVLEPAGRSARAPINPDALQLQLVKGEWKAPLEGDTVALPDGTTRAWSKASAGDDGWLRDRALRGGSAFTTVHSDSDRIALLHAQGHATVYVNGEPRAGDPYRAGYLRLPVALRKGDNEFLFLGARGEVYAALSDPPAPPYIDTADATLPDLEAGRPAEYWVGVTVVNATDAPAPGLEILASIGDVPPIATRIHRVERTTSRKVAVRIKAPALHPSEATLTLQLVGPTEGPVLSTAEFTLPVRAVCGRHTFISEVDGSVQYYAVRTADPESVRDGPPALVLSLHGASVEATNQAASYSAKPWTHIVCPTNRRPYGFDWEDWGRLDGLEALADAKKKLKYDPSRVYLTGHSMGGHGSWNLSALRPDLFAAVGPSAGWVSFQSYSGAPRAESPSPVEELLFRSAATSQTLDLVQNLAPLGIYILHGDADDNVPVTQARQMKEELSRFHTDFAYHEQAGAGHWWETSDEPGAECVDWPPMFDLFARRRIPVDGEVRAVDFTTVNPAVSSNMRWLTIQQQEKHLAPSRAILRCDPHRRRFSGTTSNVAALLLSIDHLAEPGGPVSIDLDGQTLDKVIAVHNVRLKRTGTVWAVAPGLRGNEKGPHRSGPFKSAFNQRAILVYPTRGTAEENAWGYAKARYDAETFAYRGNGSFELRPDSGFDPRTNVNRSVILYGNADCNSAWHELLLGSPIRVSRGTLAVGDKTVTGDDLACLFVRPRNGSDIAMVGAVAGTGLPGMRTTDRLPYFLSGVAYPDVTVLTPDVLREGSSAVRAAGFFGNDWSVENGEFQWND